MGKGGWERKAGSGEGAGAEASKGVVGWGGDLVGEDDALGVARGPGGVHQVGPASSISTSLSRVIVKSLSLAGPASSIVKSHSNVIVKSPSRVDPASSDRPWTSDRV